MSPPPHILKLSALAWVIGMRVRIWPYQILRQVCRKYSVSFLKAKVGNMRVAQKHRDTGEKQLSRSEYMKQAQEYNSE